MNNGETKVASLIPPSINQEFENLASTHTSIKPVKSFAKSSNLQAYTLMYRPLILKTRHPIQHHADKLKSTYSHLWSFHRWCFASINQTSWSTAFRQCWTYLKAHKQMPWSILMYWQLSQWALDWCWCFAFTMEEIMKCFYEQLTMQRHYWKLASKGSMTMQHVMAIMSIFPLDKCLPGF